MSMQAESVKQEPVPFEIGETPIKQEHDNMQAEAVKQEPLPFEIIQTPIKQEHDDFPDLLSITSKSLLDDDKEALRAALKIEPEQDTKIFPSTSKIEDEDDMFVEDVKIKKDNSELKEEIMSEDEDNDSDSEAEGLSDSGGEGPSEIKTEELMIKSESGDSDSSLEDDVGETNKQNACSRCEFKTYYKQNMKRHRILVHEIHDDKCNSKNIYESFLTMHDCDFCSYKTDNKSHLDDHVVAQHSRETAKIHQCDYCPYITDFKSDLKRHMLVDCREIGRVHACDFCDYKTHDRHQLKIHIELHDKNSIKKYVCDLCEFETHYKKILERHKIRIHMVKPDIYGCNNCSYRTKYESCLKKHISRMRCREALPKSSTSARFLKRYKTRVRMVKPDEYFCNTCSYRTKYQGWLKKHMLSVHCKKVTATSAT